MILSFIFYGVVVYFGYQAYCHMKRHYYLKRTLTQLLAQGNQLLKTPNEYSQTSFVQGYDSLHHSLKDEKNIDSVLESDTQVLLSELFNIHQAVTSQR